MEIFSDFIITSQISILVVIEVPHLPVDVAGRVSGDVGDVEGDEAGRDAGVQRVEGAQLRVGRPRHHRARGHQQVGHQAVALRQEHGGQLVESPEHDAGHRVVARRQRHRLGPGQRHHGPVS